jgi:hypothetical protein
MKCLAKEIDHRYQSAHELETAFAHCRHADGWTEEKATQWWATHPVSESGTGTDVTGLPLRAEPR